MERGKEARYGGSMEAAPTGDPKVRPLRALGFFLILLTPITAWVVYTESPTPRRFLGSLGALLILIDLWVSRTSERRVTLLRGSLPVLVVAFGLWTAVGSIRGVNLFLAQSELSIILVGALCVLLLPAAETDAAFVRRRLAMFTPVMTIALTALAFIEIRSEASPGPPRTLFGHSENSGTFIGMLAVLCAGGFLSAAGKPRSALWGLAFFASAGHLTISLSRAGQIGALGGIVFCGWLSGKRLWKTPSLRRRVLGLAGLGALGMLSGILILGERRETWMSQQVSLGTGRFRLMVWRSSLEMAAAHPVAGVGLGNYGIAYHRYRAHELEQEMHRARADYRSYPSIVEDPHSLYFRLLGEAGPIGLFLFLAVFAVGLGGFLKAWKAAPGTPFTAAIAGMTVAFLLSSIFHCLQFPGVHWFYAWIGLGLCRARREGSSLGGVPAAGIRAAVLIGIVLLCGSVVLHGSRLVHNHWIYRFRTSGGSRPEFLRYALRVHPWSQKAHLQAALVQMPERPAQAEPHVDRLLAWVPEHPVYLLLKGKIRTALGDLRAEEFVRRSAELDPAWAAPRKTLGDLLLEKGEIERALREGYDVAVRLQPKSGELHYARALALAEAGRYGEAAGELAAAEERGFPVRERFPKDGRRWQGRPELDRFLTAE